MQTRNISCHGLPPLLRETGEEKLGPAQLRGSGGSSVGSGSSVVVAVVHHSVGSDTAQWPGCRAGDNS